jgi:hypothetical protein
MANYVASAPAGAASITAAVAALIGIYNPASATMAAARIYEWSVGPGAASADNNYSVRFRRTTTGPTTWTTAITPVGSDGKTGACVTLSGSASNTTRATLVAGNVGSWGFHMRGGYRWVAIPGGEIGNLCVFNDGLELEYFYSQGTDVLEPTIWFAE